MTTPSPKLLILGDSISLGVAELLGSDIAARVQVNYVDLLRAALPNVRFIIDADVHRSTTAGRQMIDSLLAAHDPDVLLIMLGGNDADMDWKRFVLSDGKIARSRIPVETYEKNLRHIAAKALEARVTPVLTDMPNHHFELRGPYVSKLANKDVTSMLERGGGQKASDQELVKYRQVVARVAADLDIPLASYGPLLDAEPPHDMVGIDGVHPSAAAHRIIAQALLPILSNTLFSPSPNTRPDAVSAR